MEIQIYIYTDKTVVIYNHFVSMLKEYAMIIDKKNIWISYIPNDEHILSALDDAQSSSISSLTNPNKLENPTSSVMGKERSATQLKVI